jgi:cytochrome c oxidase subunit 2
MQLRAVYRVSLLLAALAGAILLAAALTVRDGAREREPAWSPASSEGPITVEVTGRDFFWRFRFAGRDGKFNTGDDVQLDKQVHLPRDRDIVFLITSDDYVYTLAIPELGLRQIAVPDLTFPLKFRTTRAGSFDILADPLCSVKYFHDENMGLAVVEPEPAFDSWYQGVP